MRGFGTVLDQLRETMAVLKFVGGMSYEGESQGSRAQLWYIDSETVMLDLVSKPYDVLQPDTHFAGVAKRRSSGRFETPWVYLMNPAGGVHIEGSVVIKFRIAHLEDEMIRIIGSWTAEDEETVFRFDSHLQRVFEFGP